MLDVLHVFFEEDMIPRWEQDAQTKSKVRVALYDSMYKKKYKYALDTETRHADFDYDNDDNEMYEPNDIYATAPDGVVKPYFPASSPEELNSILGMPLGE
jgi:hypothetical protein